MPSYMTFSLTRGIFHFCLEARQEVINVSETTQTSSQVYLPMPPSYDFYVSDLIFLSHKMGDNANITGLL